MSKISAAPSRPIVLYGLDGKRTGLGSWIPSLRLYSPECCHRYCACLAAGTSSSFEEEWHLQHPLPLLQIDLRRLSPLAWQFEVTVVAGLALSYGAVGMQF